MAAEYLNLLDTRGTAAVDSSDPAAAGGAGRWARWPDPRYATQKERWAKQQRLMHLLARPAHEAARTLAKLTGGKGSVFVVNVKPGISTTDARAKGFEEEIKKTPGPKQVQDLEQGIVQALIAQKPADIGKAGVEQAIHALKGEPVQKKIGTGFVVVTKENINNPDVQPFLYKSSC